MGGRCDFYVDPMFVIIFFLYLWENQPKFKGRFAILEEIKQIFIEAVGS